MSNQERLQNIWAMTDKSSIDAMMKKTRSPLPMAASESSSSDESSDSGVSNSTCRSFVAVPKEFRPCLSLESRHNSPCGAVPKSLIQNSDHQSKNCSSNVQKVSKNESSPAMNTLVQNKQTNLKKDEMSFKNKALAYQISCQNTGKIAHERRANASDWEMSSQSQKKAGIGSGSFEKQQRCNTKSRKSKSQTRSNELKYKCVEKQVHSHETLHLNFEVPSSCKDKKSHVEDKIQYETAVYQSESENNKPVVWQTDLKGFRSKSKHRRNGMPRQTSFQDNVRWDNTLDFSQHTDNAFNSDTDNNTEDKIKWTVAKERNTSSTRKVQAEKNATNDFTVEYKSRLADSDHLRKNTRRCRSKRSSNNTKCSKPILNQSKLNIASKDTFSKKEVYSSENQNFDLDNSNMKSIQKKILNSDIKNTSGCVNNNIFTQQCHSRDQDSTSQNIHRKDSLNGYSRFNDKVIPGIAKLNIQVNSVDKGEHANTQGARETASVADLRVMQEKRNTILEYGREMLDLIIGSHTALSLFFATYESWKTSRQQLIQHFEALERNLKETSKKCARYKDIINMARTCASAVEIVPIPHVSLAAKVVSVVTGLFSKIFNTDFAKADVGDSNDITTAVFRDAHASGDLYLYGLQCHQNFEETTKYIEKFHTRALDLEYFDAENGEMTDFIQGILEYKPNHRTFYTKLYMCFQTLRQASLHDFSRKFCEPFTLNPPAVEVVRFLSWRFRYEEFSPESVQFEMEQLHNVIQDSNVSVKDLLARVQGLLRLLHSELGFLETCVKDVTLFSNPLCQSDVRKLNF